MKKDKWERISYKLFMNNTKVMSIIFKRKRAGLPYWPYRCNSEIRWGWQ